MKRGEISTARNKSGQIIIVVAMAMVVLMGFLALATDIGYLRYMKREMQQAADAGAIAGASVLGGGGSHIQAARMDAAKNGFTHGSDGVNVEVNRPPISGAFAGDNGYVEVIVHQDQPTFFMNVLGVNSAQDVQARAVASAIASAGDGCLFTLACSVDDGALASGSATVNLSNCAIYDNSDKARAIETSGSGSFTTDKGVYVVGGCAGTCAVTPEPTLGIDHFGDPLCDPPPDGWVCGEPQTNCLQPPVYDPSACDYPGDYEAVAGDELYPGVYCGGIRVSSVPDVHFNPGTYIILGDKGFVVSGGGSVYGEEVMFYLAGKAKLEFSGGSQTVAGESLSAPTTGDYQDILFFMDRANVQKVVFSGGSIVNMDGILYASSNQVEYSGGSGSNASNLTIVSKQIKFTGPSFINGSALLSVNGGGGGSDTIALVE